MKILRPLIMLMLLPLPASAFQRTEVQGKEGFFIFWPTRTVTYMINDQGSQDVPFSEAAGAIKRSFFSWASPSCTDIYPHYGGATPDRKTNVVLGKGEAADKKNLIVWHEEQWPPAGIGDRMITEEMPAVTTVVFDVDTGVILDADLDLNGVNFFWTVTDDPNQVITDIQSIVTHEIGHLLGLDHTEDPETTMFPSTSEGQTQKRTLEQDDQDGVCFIYPFGGATPQGAGQTGELPDVEGGCGLVAGPLAPPPPSAWPVLLGLLGLLWLSRRT